MSFGVSDIALSSVVPLQSDAGGGILSGVVLLFYIGIIVAQLAGMWKVFEKADQPGWGAIVPIYNTYLLLKVAERPGWWLIGFIIPLLNIVVIAIVFNDISNNFGKGVGYTLGLIFLAFVFLPLLGFGDAEYQPSPAPV